MNKIFELTKEIHEILKNIDLDFNIGLSYKKFEAPQIRQILKHFEGVLGKEPWKIREVGGGWIAEIKEGANTFRFEVSTDFIGNKKRRFMMTMGLTAKPLGKNIWKEKKELEAQLKKYLLDKGDNYSATYLCQRWLDGLTPLIETGEEKVLTELLEVLKKLSIKITRNALLDMLHSD